MPDELILEMQKKRVEEPVFFASSRSTPKQQDNVKEKTFPLPNSDYDLNVTVFWRKKREDLWLRNYTDYDLGLAINYYRILTSLT